MLDLRTCPCAGTNLDRLVQPAILTVLSDGPLHGYRIAEQIGQRFGLPEEQPDVSGIYRFLKAMEQKGLVVSSWDLSESGPAKKSYALTQDGTRCLVRWTETLELYRKRVSTLLKAARTAAQHSGRI